MNQEVQKALVLLQEACLKINQAEAEVLIGNDTIFEAIGNLGQEAQELVEMIEQGEI